jgi:hypothetical protein
MKFKPMIILQAVLATFFGTAFVLVPQFAMEPYIGDQAVTQVFYLLARCYGAYILGIAIIAIGFISAQEIYTKKVISISIAFREFLTGIFFLFATLSGATTSIGWVMVVLSIVLVTLFVSVVLAREP